jgi:hypothetical protein
MAYAVLQSTKMSTRSRTTRHDVPVTRRDFNRPSAAPAAAVPPDVELKALLLIISALSIAAIVREVSQQITSDKEEDIRRQVASWVAERAKHREQEPNPVSWQRALTHGFGGLLDFFPDLDDQPDESSMGQRALSSATPRETSRAVNASRQIG